jgi:hypothetical protein
MVLPSGVVLAPLVLFLGRLDRGEGRREDAVEAGERRGAMNLNDNPTIGQFREMLRQHDDHAGHHVLWVRKDGEVMLTCLANEKPYRVPTYEHPQMQMCYETFPIGYEYVGPEAADDKWWTSELFRHMLEQWSKARGTPGVMYLQLHTVAPDGQPVDAEEAAEIRRMKEEFARRRESGKSGCCPGSGQ